MSKNEIVKRNSTDIIKKQGREYEIYNPDKHKNYVRPRFVWAFLTKTGLSDTGKGNLIFYFPVKGTRLYLSKKIKPVEVNIKASVINNYVKKQAEKKRIKGSYLEPYGFLYPFDFLMDIFTKKLKSLERKARKALK